MHNYSFCRTSNLILSRAEPASLIVNAIKRTPDSKYRIFFSVVGILCVFLGLKVMRGICVFYFFAASLGELEYLFFSFAPRHIGSSTFSELAVFTIAMYNLTDKTYFR